MSTTLTRTLTQSSRLLPSAKKPTSAPNGTSNKSQARSPGNISSLAQESNLNSQCTVDVWIYRDLHDLVQGNMYTLRVAYIDGSEISHQYDGKLPKLEPGPDYPDLSDDSTVMKLHDGIEYFRVKLQFGLTLGVEPRYWIAHKPESEMSKDDYHSIGFGQLYEIGYDNEGKVIPEPDLKLTLPRSIGISNKILASVRLYSSTLRASDANHRRLLTEHHWLPGDGFIQPPKGGEEEVQIWFEKDPDLTSSDFGNWGHQSNKRRLEFSMSHSHVEVRIDENGNWSDLPEFGG